MNEDGARLQVSKVAGQDLRQARESAGLSLRALAKLTTFDHSTLGHVETGRTAVSLAHIRAYELALGVSLSPRAAYVAKLGMVPLADSVSPADVNALEESVDMLTGLGLRHGGRFIAEAAKGQLRYGVGLLDASPNFPGLADVVGRLADRTAWSLSEVTQHGKARKVFNLALEVVTGSTVREMITVNVAAHHLTTGDPNGALHLLDTVSGSLPVLAFSAHGARARVYGSLGDLQATLREIGRADEAHANVNLDDLPECFRPFASGHAAHADREAGTALFLVARMAQRRAKVLAVQRLEAALESFGPDRSNAAERCRQRLSELVG